MLKRKRTRKPALTTTITGRKGAVNPVPAVASPYLSAIDNHDRDDAFRAFNSRVVMVLVKSVEACGQDVTKDRLLHEIETQGNGLSVEVMDTDVARDLEAIRGHNPEHFQLMTCSAIAAIKIGC